MTPALGVCYYPEHWPERQWADDAARMADAGLTWVRVGEFAWSRLEPEPGEMRLDWLERAVDTLGDAGLRVVMSTPTATPPRWMLDRHPDMLAVDASGRPRRFGSRRHYDFSHDGYRDACVRIADILGERFGRHAHVGAWQIDNEYGCHDTVLSYSPAAAGAFRAWLAQRYETIAALNRAWGNVFWSMEYTRFEQIEPPNLTVTTPNPAHVLAFRRFASDQVVRFNRAQAEALRRHTEAPIGHNFMGREIGFDHWAVARDLDIATWDSYPIGFLSDRLDVAPERRALFLRQGDPDMQAFHHDLYRGAGARRTGGSPSAGRFWVMEQQPGPVNWAPWNPAPPAGAVRLWTWEAIAHGAEAVAYFRWRQAPSGQEQMHAGLLRPDGADAPALAEVAETAREIADAGDIEAAPAPAALVFDYAAAWAWQAERQGADFDYFALCLDAYRALRRAGLSVDVIAPDTGDLSPWKIVVAPGLAWLETDFADAVARHRGRILLGPRSGAKTPEMAIPLPLPPAIPGLSATVVAVESLPPGVVVDLTGGGRLERWVEHLETDDDVYATTTDGAPVIVRADTLVYLGGWPDADTFHALVRDLASEVDLDTTDLPDGLRLRDSARHRFAINYTQETHWVEDREIGPLDVVRWER